MHTHMLTASSNSLVPTDTHINTEDCTNPDNAFMFTAILPLV